MINPEKEHEKITRFLVSSWNSKSTVIISNLHYITLCISVFWSAMLYHRSPIVRPKPHVLCVLRPDRRLGPEHHGRHGPEPGDGQDLEMKQTEPSVTSSFDLQRTHGETMRSIKKYGKANLVLCLHCYHFSLRKSLLKAPGSANTRSAHFELILKPSECIRMGFKPSLASLQDGDSDCYIVWTLIHHS